MQDDEGRLGLRPGGVPAVPVWPKPSLDPLTDRSELDQSATQALDTSLRLSDSVASVTSDRSSEPVREALPS
jgi:hypothetical protein